MRRDAASVLAVFALVLVPVAVARACLWDRDTLAAEARGLPGVVAVLTGRFDRFPARYYEMRLERVAEELKSRPDDLALYDDAGVACDRLGRGADALGWMAQKRAKLDARDASDPAVREALYRTHANLGTFLVHKWIREGADRSRLDQVQEARGAIAAAIALKPDAHFGREKYQLMALDWLLAVPRKGPGLNTLLDPALGEDLLVDFDALHGNTKLPEPIADAALGLSGLVVLGDAWESLDVFHALGLALLLDGAKSSVAFLARLRCEELIDAGRRSLDPGLPAGDALKAALFDPGRALMPEDQARLRKVYRALRDEANAWQVARTAFVTDHLAAGRHPDTDPTFWDGYRDTPPPSLAALDRRFDGRAALARRWGLSRGQAEAIAVGLVAIPALAALAALGLGLQRRRRARRAKPPAFDPDGLTATGDRFRRSG
jgi:hypothetical protein